MSLDTAGLKVTTAGAITGGRGGIMGYGAKAGSRVKFTPAGGGGGMNPPPGLDTNNLTVLAQRATAIRATKASTGSTKAATNQQPIEGITKEWIAAVAKCQSCTSEKDLKAAITGWNGLKDHEKVLLKYIFNITVDKKIDLPHLKGKNYAQMCVLIATTNHESTTAIENFLDDCSEQIEDSQKEDICRSLIETANGLSSMIQHGRPADQDDVDAGTRNTTGGPCALNDFIALSADEQTAYQLTASQFRGNALAIAYSTRNDKKGTYPNRDHLCAMALIRMDETERRAFTQGQEKRLDLIRFNHPEAVAAMIAKLEVPDAGAGSSPAALLAKNKTLEDLGFSSNRAEYNDAAIDGLVANLKTSIAAAAPDAAFVQLLGQAADVQRATFGSLLRTTDPDTYQHNLPKTKTSAMSTRKKQLCELLLTEAFMGTALSFDIAVKANPNNPARRAQIETRMAGRTWIHNKCSGDIATLNAMRTAAEDAELESLRNGGADLTHEQKEHCKALAEAIMHPSGGTAHIHPADTARLLAALYTSNNPAKKALAIKLYKEIQPDLKSIRTDLTVSENAAIDELHDKTGWVREKTETLNEGLNNGVKVSLGLVGNVLGLLGTGLQAALYLPRLAVTNLSATAVVVLAATAAYNRGSIAGTAQSLAWGAGNTLGCIRHPGACVQNALYQNTWIPSSYVDRFSEGFEQAKTSVVSSWKSDEAKQEEAELQALCDSVDSVRSDVWQCQTEEQKAAPKTVETLNARIESLNVAIKAITDTPDDDAAVNNLSDTDQDKLALLLANREKAQSELNELSAPKAKTPFNDRKKKFSI